MNDEIAASIKYMTDWDVTQSVAYSGWGSWGHNPYNSIDEKFATPIIKSTYCECMLTLSNYSQGTAGSRCGWTVPGCQEILPRDMSSVNPDNVRHRSAPSAASTGASSDTRDANPPALKKFKFLATKLSTLTTETTAASGGSSSNDNVHGQLLRYIAELEQNAVDDAHAFWASRRSSYKLLAPVADLLTAPASQVFVERIFSLCGLCMQDIGNEKHLLTDVTDKCIDLCTDNLIICQTIFVLN